MKEKIAEIIKTYDQHHPDIPPDKYYETVADQILALFPSLDGIMVKEECIERTSYPCPLCNNTGTITRQATWEDMEIFWSKIWDVELPAEVLTTKSGGRLRVK